MKQDRENMKSFTQFFRRTINFLKAFGMKMRERIHILEKRFKP